MRETNSYIDVYEKQLNLFQKEIKNLKKTLEEEQEVMLTLKQVSQLQKNNVITFLNAFVSNLLSKIYNSPQEFSIEVEEQKNNVKIKFFISEDDTRIEIKKPFVGKGGGKLSVISMALKLALMQVKGIKGAIFLDEATKMVDNTALTMLNTFLEEYAKETKTQLFLISHQDTPEVPTILLKKENGKTSYEMMKGGLS